MPKFVVNMNMVEIQRASFVLEAKNEEDVRDALSELDYSYFLNNLKWKTSDFEPPLVDAIDIVKGRKNISVTSTKAQTAKIQKKFNTIIEEFNRMENME